MRYFCLLGAIHARIGLPLAMSVAFHPDLDWLLVDGTASLGVVSFGVIKS